MGDRVNLASRLEGANKIYGTPILIGPRTHELARADIEAREIDVVRLKGKQESVVVYELLSRKGELAEERSHLMQLYGEGLRAYRGRDFETAIARFEAALALDSSDGPSRLYLGRAQECLVTPPPPDWPRVYEMESK